VQEAIEERVMRAIAAATHTPIEQLTPDATFEELGMTSLDALAVVAELEEEFGVEIPNEDAMALRDVRQAVECVRTLTASGAAQL
jgi:acyl carrier protein